MKKIKVIIAIFAALMVALIVILCILNQEEIKYTGNNIVIHDEVGSSSVYKIDLKIENNKKRYYGVESTINNYFLFLNEEDEILEENETREHYIYSILNDNYIKENNITEENIWEHVRPFGKNKQVIINEMYVRETSDYFVEYLHVILYDKNQLDNKYNFNYTFDKMNLYYRVNVDSMNSTYDIQPITQEEFNSKSIVEDTEINIEKNEYNLINFSTNPTEAVMCMKYMNNYKDKMRYDIESAYEVLNEKYREKRFGSLEKYKEYILENKDWIDIISVDKYKTDYNNEYKEYVCLDKNGNYYIFKETAIMQYTLELDTYTLEDEKFATEYNKSDEQKKIMMNIDKFINMINNKDYKNLYSLLSEAFRNNYFKTEEEYENYIKDNFFEYNEEIYIYYEKENDIYSYEIQIKDKSGKDTNIITKNIIMQLKDGTDFVMAFNI